MSSLRYLSVGVFSFRTVCPFVCPRCPLFEQQRHKILASSLYSYLYIVKIDVLTPSPFIYLYNDFYVFPKVSVCGCNIGAIAFFWTFLGQQFWILKV